MKSKDLNRIFAQGSTNSAYDFLRLDGNGNINARNKKVVVNSKNDFVSQAGVPIDFGGTGKN